MIFNSPHGMTPYWFIGEVVDNNDPTNNARVRVRVFGLHTPDPFIPDNDKEDLDRIDDQDLPWAFCVDGSYGAVNAIPDEGDWVMGFFADGRDAQHPILLGIIPGSNLDDAGAAPVQQGAAFGGTSGANNAGTGGTGGDPNAATGNRRNVVADPTSVAELENDPAFQAEFERLQARYPTLTRDQIYRTIQGESAFNPTVVNPDSGATGLFQFIPSTAEGLGYTTAQIRGMTPAQQLSVYGEYLDSNGYAGGPLGIMQAAPAFAGRPGNTIVYPHGTRAWDLNPGWRGPNGEITVNSINAYYGY